MGSRILAFDLGTTGAWAFNRGFSYAPARLGTWNLIGENRVEKLAWFSNYLDVFAGEDYGVVIYERPFVRGRAATRFLWGMAGIVEAHFGYHSAVVDEAVSSIKKHVTGSGRATKEDMIAAVSALGWNPSNDHEADAAAVCQYCIDNMEVIDAKS